jgi:hypothetical protein
MVVEGWVAFRPRVYRFVARLWSEEQHNLLEDHVRHAQAIIFFILTSPA